MWKTTAKLDLKIMKTMIFQQLANFIQTESKVMFPPCHSRPGRRNMGLGGAHPTHFPAVTPYRAFTQPVTLLNIWSCGSSQQKDTRLHPHLNYPQGDLTGRIPRTFLLAQMVCVCVKHMPTDDRGMVTMVGKNRAGETPGIGTL